MMATIFGNVTFILIESSIKKPTQKVELLPVFDCS